MTRYSMAPSTPYGSRPVTPKSTKTKQTHYSFPVLETKGLYVDSYTLFCFFVLICRSIHQLAPLYDLNNLTYYISELFSCLDELCSVSLTDEEFQHCEKHVPAVRRLFEIVLECLTGMFNNLFYCWFHIPK
jgi:hypothetical protein